MFKEMRRKDRAMDKAGVIEILKKGDYGILSTVGQDGYPYGVPVSYIYFNDSVYFHCALEGHKLDDISINNRVSFCVVGQADPLPDKFSVQYKSVILFGRASEVSPDEKNQVLMEILNKYSPDYIEKGKEYISNSGKATKVIRINIEHITGKERK